MTILLHVQGTDRARLTTEHRSQEGEDKQYNSQVHILQNINALPVMACSGLLLQGTGIDNNYVIRDSNCDGVFDGRYGLAEDFHVPDCLRPQTGILRPPGTPPVP